MKSFLKSFVYAFRGVWFCICNERNVRIHICFTVYMFGFLGFHDFFDVSRTEIAVLAGFCALVLSLEAVNTAVEKAVDLATEEIKELARLSKDAAAGAVLISAIASVAAGVVILWQPEAFAAMFDYYKENIPMLAILIISLAISIIFIKYGPLGIVKQRYKK